MDQIRAAYFADLLTDDECAALVDRLRRAVPQPALGPYSLVKHSAHQPKSGGGVFDDAYVAAQVASGALLNLDQSSLRAMEVGTEVFWKSSQKSGPHCNQWIKSIVTQQGDSSYNKKFKLVDGSDSRMCDVDPDCGEYLRTIASKPQKPQRVLDGPLSGVVMRGRIAFEVGDCVKANYHSHGKLYDGKVIAVHNPWSNFSLDTIDIQYDIHYDDGDVEYRVVAENIQWPDTERLLESRLHKMVRVKSASKGWGEHVKLGDEGILTQYEDGNPFLIIDFSEKYPTEGRWHCGFADIVQISNPGHPYKVSVISGQWSFYAESELVITPPLPGHPTVGDWVVLKSACSTTNGLVLGERGQIKEDYSPPSTLGHLSDRLKKVRTRKGLSGFYREAQLLHVPPPPPDVVPVAFMCMPQNGMKGFDVLQDPPHCLVRREKSEERIRDEVAILVADFEEKLAKTFARVETSDSVMLKIEEDARRGIGTLFSGKRCDPRTHSEQFAVKCPDPRTRFAEKCPDGPDGSGHVLMRGVQASAAQLDDVREKIAREDPRSYEMFIHRRELRHYRDDQHDDLCAMIKMISECNICYETPEVASAIFCCRECDYNLCAECYCMVSGKPTTESSIPLSIAGEPNRGIVVDVNAEGSGLIHQPGVLFRFHSATLRSGSAMPSEGEEVEFRISTGAHDKPQAEDVHVRDGNHGGGGSGGSAGAAAAVAKDC